MGSKLVCVYTTITSVLSISIVYASLLGNHTASSLPLSTSSPWIVDASTGSRVKLSCVNWASHFTPMLAEGLHLLPLESIAHTVVTWGFNCVRLSWSTSMFTNKTLAEARVSRTFQALGLEHELEGVARFNGKLVGMTSVEAFKEVVQVLGKEGLMVVLDNRVGDEDASFDDEIWAQGLQIVASLFKGWPFVVGMTLRHEHNKSTEDWFRHMQTGAEAINSQNSDLLLMYQGLRNGEGLHNLMERPLSKGLRQKMVYEVHFHTKQSTVDTQCEAVIKQIWKSIAIPTDSTMAYTDPLLVGEFGLERFGQSLEEKDECFAPCFTDFAAQGDMDFAVWVLQGSYYLRRGVQDDDETCGLFNHLWTAPRNAALRRNLQQVPFIQDKGRRPHMVLFHPATALCVNKVNPNGLEMGSCNEASKWRFLPQGLIALDHTYLVIGAQGPNQRAILELQGTEANGPWAFSNRNLSTHYMQVSTSLVGQTLCLDSPSPPALLTSPCSCLDVPTSSSNPRQCADSQWFTFVSDSH